RLERSRRCKAKSFGRKLDGPDLSGFGRSARRTNHILESPCRIAMRPPKHRYTSASAPDGSLHLSISRAARIALTRAEVFVAAIPLVTTQLSTLTSQLQLEPPGSSLRQYEMELTMRLIPYPARHCGVGYA